MSQWLDLYKDFNVKIMWVFLFENRVCCGQSRPLDRLFVFFFFLSFVFFLFYFFFPFNRSIACISNRFVLICKKNKQFYYRSVVCCCFFHWFFLLVLLTFSSLLRNGWENVFCFSVTLGVASSMSLSTVCTLISFHFISLDSDSRVV